MMSERPAFAIGLESACLDYWIFPSGATSISNWDDGAEFTVEVADNGEGVEPRHSVHFIGNRAALRSLARHCLSLLAEGREKDYYAWVDDSGAVELRLWHSPNPDVSPVEDGGVGGKRYPLPPEPFPDRVRGDTPFLKRSSWEKAALFSVFFGGLFRLQAPESVVSACLRGTRPSREAREVVSEMVGWMIQSGWFELCVPGSGEDNTLVAEGAEAVGEFLWGSAEELWLRLTGKGFDDLVALLGQSEGDEALDLALRSFGDPPTREILHIATEGAKRGVLAIGQLGANQ